MITQALAINYIILLILSESRRLKVTPENPSLNDNKIFPEIPYILIWNN